MKKQISLLLAVLMCASAASALTSCSEAGTDEKTADNTSNEITNAAEEETEYIDPFAGTNYAGRDFRVYTSINTFDSTNGDRFIRGSGELTGEMVNDAVFKRNSDVCELLNINLAFTEADYDYGTVESKIQASIMSGIDEWDVMVNDMSTFANLSKDNYIRNVYNSEILDFSQSYWYSDAMNDLMLVDGGSYLLIGDYFTDSLASVHTLYVNESLLNDYYNDPEYINKKVLDGNWTFDAMTEVVSSCYQDTDGNGVMEDGDQFGFTCIGMWGPIVPFVIGANVQFVERTDEGLQFCFNNEHSIKVIEKLNNMFYSGGALTKLNDMSITGMRNIFANGKTLIMGYSRLGDLENFREIEFSVGCVVYPKLDENQEKYVTSMHGTSEIGAIPVTLPEESVEFCHTVLEVLSRETSKTLIPEYYENGLKVKYSNGQDDAMMIDLIHDSIGSPFAVTYDGSMGNMMLSYTFCTLLQEESTDFASAYAKNIKVSQKLLEKVYKSFIEVIESGN